jgi:hypothetical protein
VGAVVEVTVVEVVLVLPELRVSVAQPTENVTVAVVVTVEVCVSRSPRLFRHSAPPPTARAMPKYAAAAARMMRLKNILIVGLNNCSDLARATFVSELV